MFSRRVILIISLLTFIGCISVLNAAPAGDQVDSIYDTIRNRGPQHQWEAQELTFQNQGMNLVGTLTTPKVTHK